METSRILELGSYVLDREGRRLFRRETVSLAPRTEAILLALAGSPGEVVADSDLRETWSIEVDQANLATQIKNLRKKVGDTEKEKVTIQRDSLKTGYRLVYDEKIDDLILFRDFLLDRKRPRLYKIELVKLEPVLMGILTALAERPGQVVEDRVLVRRVVGEFAAEGAPGVDLTAEIRRLNEFLGEAETPARIRSAEGYLLNLEKSPGAEPKKWVWVQVVLPWLPAAVAVLALGGFLFWCLDEEPALSLSCAPVIESHQHRIFGTLRRQEPDAAIVGYVRPENEESRYYRQGLARIDDEDWWLDARFGNEESRGMSAELPLHFRAFVVYVSPASLARTLDATWQDPQAEAPSDQAFLERLREGIEERRGSFLASNRCRIYRVASRDCAGRIPTVLHPAESRVHASPIAFRWEGEEPMYLELRRNTSVIEVAGSPERSVQSGVVMDLEAGKYELKVSTQPSFSCPAILWFDVVSEASRESER